jgi:hypothetical protein
MKCESAIETKGHVEYVVDYKNGKSYKVSFPNVVLITGRQALAQVLTNTLGTCPSTNTSSTASQLVPALYINEMLFGSNGTDTGGTPLIVSPARPSLFGPATAIKPVNSYVSQAVATQANFTATLLYSDAVLQNINEMALRLTNGNLYSMVTFPSIYKTADMQITFNWSLNFI